MRWLGIFMSSVRFDVYAPLEKFGWDGGDIDLGLGIKISRLNQSPNLYELPAMLSQREREMIASTVYWVTLVWNEADPLSASESINLVLLALWLAKPTKAQVQLRFQVGQNALLNGYSRLLDRFNWIEDATHEEFMMPDLIAAASYYPVLRDVCVRRGRLNDALILTLAGCCAHKWQVSLISHSAAIEALLTYDKGGGLTHRLANSYACLVSEEKKDRDAAYSRFSNLYKMRSDVIHGRSYNVLGNDRLPGLAELRDVLRELWKISILTPSLITTLERDDTQRRMYFQIREENYDGRRITPSTDTTHTPSA